MDRSELERRFRAVLESGSGTFDPAEFAALLNIPLSELAHQIGVHHSTLVSSPQTPSVQIYLQEVTRAWRSAFDIAGEASKTLFWYRNEPLPAFSYKTAETLIIERRGPELLRFLETVAAGPAG